MSKKWGSVHRVSTHKDSIIYRISIVYVSYMYRVCIVTISGIMAEKVDDVLIKTNIKKTK